jgi:hypothetical protein
VLRIPLKLLFKFMHNENVASKARRVVLDHISRASNF